MPPSSEAKTPEGGRSLRRRAGVGAAMSIAVMFAMLSRFAARPNRPVAIAAAASPVVAAASAVFGLLLSAHWRGRLGGLAAAGLGVAALAGARKSLHDSGRRALTPRLRVASANILLGRAEASALVTWAASHTDVLIVQELTAEAVVGLSAAGICDVFEHSVVEARPRAAGIGVWSRHRIVQTRHVDELSMPSLLVKLRVPGCPLDPTVVAVHLESPLDIAVWRADLAMLPSVLRDADRWAAGGCVVVAGDFNSTRDMRPFRDGLAGYSDAAEQAGVWYPATFPNLAWWMIPLFVIDHILTLRCTATEVCTAGIAGSDHRALLAEIHLGPT